MSPERIEQVLSSLSQHMEVDAIDRAKDDGAESEVWLIAFAGEHPVFISSTGRGEHWVMAGTVGDPPVQARDDFFAFAMLYNGQPELSGGFRLGLEEPEGMLKLSIDLTPEDWDELQFAALVSEFRRNRSDWARIAETWHPSAAKPGDALDLSPMNRV